eukprot:sb/3471867/
MVVKSEKSVGMRWRVDFTTRSKHSWQNPPPLSNPIGYCEDFERVPDLEQEDNNAHLIVKRSWDIALVPLKQVPMNLFLMWMIGNTISIFPIIMTVMMFKSPIASIFSYKTTFQKLEGGHHILQKVVYILSNFVLIGMALYKCSAMGLLPTHQSDWIAFELPKTRMEFAAGGAVLMS